MATKASAVLRAARKASLASRAAAAAASRAAAVASRSARVARVAADIACAARLSSDLIRHPKSCSDPRFPTSADYEDLPEDATIPTDKDLESDDAVWALYERWCEAVGKNRNYGEMIRRFKIFRYNAEVAQKWNTGVPSDPKKAAICRRKRRSNYFFQKAKMSHTMKTGIGQRC
ncbi:uncharacterized protein LOC120701371 [Panicum virgatum]|uniref:Cathepsin propeptide inhibitor domain-containing protein n=1 Tax=Panicum virgatum TaxID=38727 RepID=A0A8T0V4B5_PANVG|nr:uncharacterized protein LOC120701371 [Panicum virgatum]KAG2627733.1 hypothetical protein PVAP13_3KG262264 [Panicum virgatum]